MTGKLQGGDRVASPVSSWVLAGLFLVGALALVVFDVRVRGNDVLVGLAGVALGLVAPLLIGLVVGRGKIAAWNSRFELYGTVVVVLTFYLLGASPLASLACMSAYFSSFGVGRSLVPASMLRRADER